ncbi:hypothetical protein OAG52_05240, partial [Verrucomicrobia bacterium]|nr:hypothetical protein [Verrucomicrobiota bacterium]
TEAQDEVLDQKQPKATLTQTQTAPLNVLKDDEATVDHDASPTLSLTSLIAQPESGFAWPGLFL